MKPNPIELQRSKRAKRRLAQNLISCRTVAGLTQLQVCNQLGWDVTLLSQYETGRRAPRAKKIIELARLYRVEPSALTGV